MATLPIPEFFDTDEQAIIDDAIAYYENLTGKKLAPAQAETALIDTFAYREKILRIAGNEACRQMLLEFATYPALDYLGDQQGVERLPASAAECNMRFTMVTGNPQLIIPAGVRIQSTDGKVVFVTLVDTTVLANTATTDVLVQCTTEGTAGNGYTTGNISIILDPQAFVASAANTDTTNSGADTETDDHYRERIRLAPNTFSVAGPEDAYKFFARSANAAIIDVEITSPNPGDVAITALMEGGTVPSSQVQGQILAKCNPEKVRPLNDNVYILNPTAVDFTIEVELTLLNDAIDADVLAQVNANLLAYTQARKTKLGLDVMLSQLVAVCSVPGVYDVDITSPTTDQVISLIQFANCTDINVSITGHSNP